MAMLPVFMLGLTLGIAISYAWYMYKRDVPSEVKLKLQEAEIIKYKSDVQILLERNQLLLKEIKELRNKKQRG